MELSSVILHTRMYCGLRLHNLLHFVCSFLFREYPYLFSFAYCHIDPSFCSERVSFSYIPFFIFSLTSVVSRSLCPSFTHRTSVFVFFWNLKDLVCCIILILVSFSDVSVESPSAFGSSLPKLFVQLLHSFFLILYCFYVSINSKQM